MDCIKFIEDLERAIEAASENVDNILPETKKPTNNIKTGLTIAATSITTVVVWEFIAKPIANWFAGKLVRWKKSVDNEARMKALQEDSDDGMMIDGKPVKNK